MVHKEWDQSTPNQKKHYIALRITAIRKLNMANFHTGIALGLALGQATTPEEAIQNLDDAGFMRD